MEFKDLLIILVGAIVFVFILVGLNNFVGGNPLFMYFGTPVLIGIGAMVGGGFFTLYVSSNHT